MAAGGCRLGRNVGDEKRRRKVEVERVPKLIEGAKMNEFNMMGWECDCEELSVMNFIK